MVAPDELENVGKLHEVGIRTIIPIGSGYSELKDECEKLLKDFFKFLVNSSALNPLLIAHSARSLFHPLLIQYL